MSSVDPSDGVFRYYWSTDRSLEVCRGPFDIIADAEADALKEFNDHHWGPRPGETIHIVRCDKRLTVAPDFGRLTEIILEAFGEKNEDCFNEDGFEGLVSAGPVSADLAQQHLESALTYAFEAWQMTHRANIKTWCFGKVQDVKTFDLPDFGSEDANTDFIVDRNVRAMWRTPQDQPDTTP